MNSLPSFNECTIAIIGLGYVGLPLAVEFATVRKCVRTSCKLNRKVIAFDVDKTRIGELERYHDRTNEVSPDSLREAVSLQLTCDISSLSKADVFIVTVPTIDNAKKPDFSPLESASKTIGLALHQRSLRQPLRLLS